MKNTAVLIFIVLFALTSFAQPPKRTPRNFKKPIAKVNPALEKETFEKAVALADAAERIAALGKFVADYPKSKEQTRALELLTSARAALGDEKFRAGEKEAGIELFKLAVRETPKPISDKLFAEVVAQIPNSLFFRGEAAAASDVAVLVEEKADGNAKQMLALATFYLGMERAADAKRLVEKAILIEPNSSAAYQTLGLAHRLDFNLEESANAYAKALELDANSAIAKRSLAEMKRATGKPTEAVALYREILANDAADAAAQTGLVLALFDADNKAEAETELAKSLEAKPNNLLLLTGAAYWYAARGDGARAIELAEKAVAVEPRYTWARIALARGLMQQKRSFDAEKTLLAARQYGDFPTLDYELAAARYQSGFYREAAEILQRNFTLNDGAVRTKLGGRVRQEAKSFVELLAAERRAGIFQTSPADSIESAEKLKSLLDFYQKIERAPDETIIAATDEFIKGDDGMKLHRQLFAAASLLEKRKASPKVLELTKAAIGGVETGLDAPNATAAILADELYQSRRIAVARSEMILVPDVPRRTLSDIVRGRIEEIAGWALFQENKPAEAVTRLKRAVSVLPEKSSYWRGAMWRLGAAQETAGNQKDALDAYIKSYTSGEADAVKYGIVEAVYQKVNGSTDGLDLKIGAKPAFVAASFPVPTETKSVETQKPEPPPAPEAKTETAPTNAETTPPVAENSPTPEISSAETPIKTEPTPPTETKPAEVKTEEAPPPPPTERKIETKQPEPIRNSDPQSAAVKPLFEPIIINVPKAEPLRKASETAAKPIEEKPSPEKSAEEERAEETSAEIKPTEPKPSEENSSEENPVAQKSSESETPEVESNAEKKPAVGNTRSRPRVIIEDRFAPATICRLNFSQEKLSILTDGGNASLLVGFDGEPASNEIKATSNSPADVAVVFEPDARVTSGRAFFVVKSISRTVGLFTVTFESACGKKEISVRVR